MDRLRRARLTTLVIVITLASGMEILEAQESGGGGDASGAELAKKLSNPIASLISFPLQANFDFKIGPEDGGWRETLNVQPVIPITISKDWNMISRTILPITYQSDIAPGLSSQGGLGDVLQSLFRRPALLGRIAARRSERLGLPLGYNVPLPEVTRQPMEHDERVRSD